MELSARNSITRTLAMIIVGLFIMLFISITGATYLIFTNRGLIHDQKRTLVPMAWNAPVTISDTTADANWYRMNALSFLALRLNVTPETVDSNHALLLSYVKPSARDEVKRMLMLEAARIKRSDAVSSFYPTEFKIYPVDGRVDVQGILKTWIGNDKPLTEITHYRLDMPYHDGMTFIGRFIEVKNEK
ncbi:type IV conjugative transfer system protein TraE [Scandinavium goeteborgense]|uniref:Conjugal transfer pilus assembly protein TraE n=1 Tax=Scandinavium goeteborgense TaxID=1851514 RepID=A0A4R6E1A4_SCAGO|nr:type IV conjugative transfer system protein TraE [Scandinavium goeteborgense]TDN51500.1 conjugal transfer pilus assembly protein TraE [Scandinavium goeteborgense]